MRDLFRLTASAAPDATIGRPVREVQEGGIKTPMLEAFPIDPIERIEVVKGPGSVLNGSEACAGLINIITTTPSNGARRRCRAGCQPIVSRPRLTP